MKSLLDRATWGGLLVIGSMAKYPKATMNRAIISTTLSSTLGNVNVINDITYCVCLIKVNNCSKTVLLKFFQGVKNFKLWN